MRAPKACCEIGCTALVYDGGSRCSEHKSAGKWGPKRGRTNRTARSEHKKRRIRTLERDSLCQLRYENICTMISTVADHVVPLSVRPDLDVDWNLQGACLPCSNRKSSMEGHYLAGHDVPCPWPEDGETFRPPVSIPRPPRRPVSRVPRAIGGNYPLG